MKGFWRTIPHSMFDFKEYYGMVAERLPDGCRLAEVGVADGASALYLAERLHLLGKTYEFKMIDNLDYGKTEQLQTIITNVTGSALPNIEVIPVDSLNASLKFPDGLFDFVFIDSGHTYELTKAEILLWSRKVKHGGYLAGHDFHTAEPVNKAVNEVWFGVIADYKTAKGYGVWELEIGAEFKKND